MIEDRVLAELRDQGSRGIRADMLAANLELSTAQVNGALRRLRTRAWAFPFRRDGNWLVWEITQTGVDALMEKL